MRKYVFDTDICAYILNGDRRLLTKMALRSPEALHVSVITEAELRFGAAKSSSPAKSLHKLEGFLKPLTKLSFSSEDAAVYAGVRAKLERSGKPIGPLDTIIGAHALARDMILVTNNEREFSRIDGLSIDNWSK